MKVCHLTSVHIYNDTRIFVKECSSLAEHYETYLIAPNAPNGTENSVHVHGVNDNKGKLRRMTKTVREVYRKAVELDVDVYHFHDPELIFVGLLLSRKGKQVIYDVHEDVPKQIFSKDWIPRFLKKPISVAIEKIERYASKRFSGIVTATPEINNRFKSYNANSFSVQNFSLMSEWEEDKESIRIRKNEREFRTVYVGSITKPRGIIEMIKALEKLNEASSDKHVKLLLGGQFAPSELGNEIERLKGWKHVEFLGWLERGRVRDTFRMADAGLVLIHPEPRYKVSYPVKLFEYMSVGLPVITSDFPLWRSIVDECGCGLCVNPLNPSEIAEAIHWLLNHPQEAKEMGENGRRAVKDKYSWETQKEKLLRLYKNLEKR